MAHPPPDSQTSFRSSVKVAFSEAFPSPLHGGPQPAQHLLCSLLFYVLVFQTCSHRQSILVPTLGRRPLRRPQPSLLPCSSFHGSAPECGLRSVTCFRPVECSRSGGLSFSLSELLTTTCGSSGDTPTWQRDQGLARVREGAATQTPSQGSLPRGSVRQWTAAS